MGYASPNNNSNYNPIIKTKVSSADKSCIEEDSFIDSLLNFEGWGIEKDIVIMNSNPNLMEKEVNNNNNKEIDIIIKQQQEEEEEGVVVCDKLDVLIQQGLDNFSLTSSDAAPAAAAAADQVVVDNGLESTSLVIKDDVGIQNEVKVDTNNNGGVKKGELDDDEEDEEVNESSSSFSGSSSSSGDDDEEEDDEEDDEDEGKKVKGDGEMEEGEIMEEMVAWSDNDDEEEDVVKGPIRSRNEVQLNWISLQSLQCQDTTSSSDTSSRSCIIDYGCTSYRGRSGES